MARIRIRRLEKELIKLISNTLLFKIRDKRLQSVTITADGGVRTGYDVLKMLALGADAVFLGRDIIRAAVGAGTLGVKLHLEHIKKILKKLL